MKICSCPLTFELMRTSIISADCITYEGAVINEWLDVHGTSPISRVPVTPPMLRLNRVVLDVTRLIREWWPGLARASQPEHQLASVSSPALGALQHSSCFCFSLTRRGRRKWEADSLEVSDYRRGLGQLISLGLRAEALELLSRPLKDSIINGLYTFPESGLGGNLLHMALSSEPKFCAFQRKRGALGC